MADNDCSNNDDKANVPPTKPRFGKTQKGKLMLIDHQWHCYTQDGTKGSRAFWKCLKKNSKKCKGRAATIPDEGHKVVYQSNNHNHTSDIIKTQVRLKEQEVVARAVQNPGVPPRQILGQMAMEVGDTAELAAKTPNANLTRQINYQRKKENSLSNYFHQIKR
jgi:FLYWCH zinc finger domain